MQGRKTHEQQVRILERKPDTPDGRELDRASGRNIEDSVHRAQPEARFNQESDHNKHNHSGQSGHKPPKPTPAQQKH